ncbi:MAG: DUF4923 family protein, partial [Muribaculaceae bacterium]|nr:DUF4923 family protein [Muribaculaceae bacterium]
FAAAALLSLSLPASAEPSSAPDLKDVLGGLGGALGNAVEGVFTKTDLTVEDIAGEWTANGSAVTFQSDNFLKKAGGVAAAGAVESQLDPYYSKFGLNGAVLNIDKEGNFTLTIRKIPVKGTLKVKSKGVFSFKFMAFGSIGLGTMNAYVEKTPSGLNVMFDADKIKKIMTFAASLSGNQMVSAADKILKEYDGICIGFKMTGKAAEGNKSAADSAIDALRGLIGM